MGWSPLAVSSSPALCSRGAVTPEPAGAAAPGTGPVAMSIAHGQRRVLLGVAQHGHPPVGLDLGADGRLPEALKALARRPGNPVVGFGLDPIIERFLDQGVEVAMPVDLRVGVALADGTCLPGDGAGPTLPGVVSRFLGQPLGSSDIASAPDLAAIARQADLALRLLGPVEQASWATGTHRAWALENEVLVPLKVLERNGFPVVVDALDAFLREVEADIESRTADLRAELGNVNLMNGDDVLRALRRKTWIPRSVNSVSEVTLPSARAVTRLRQRHALARTVREYVERARPTGILSSTFHSLGSTTGRITSSNPCLQSVTTDRRVRACFVAGDGHRLVIADYAAIDLRVLAHFAGDPALVAAFQAGADPHRLTAAMLLGKPVEDISADERQLAKPVNFGVAFGMGPDALVEYARQHGVTLDGDRARRLHAAFFAAYPTIRDWQQRTRAEAGRVGFLRSASGRLRRFVGPEGLYTKALVTPIQGTEADGLKRALALLHPKLAALGAQLVNVVHDELVVRSPAETAEETARVVKESMELGMSEFVPSVPILAATRVADDWVKA